MNLPGGWLGVAVAILVILAILWFLGIRFRADAAEAFIRAWGVSE